MDSNTFLFEVFQRLEMVFRVLCDFASREKIIRVFMGMGGCRQLPLLKLAFQMRVTDSLLTTFDQTRFRVAL
jgi:hypothetical protein